MTCYEAEPLLHAYFDGETDLKTSVAVAAHLETCDSCAGTYRTLEQLRAAIAESDLEFPADAALARIRQTVLPERKARTNWWSFGWIPAVAIAALALAIYLPQRAGSGDAVEREIVDSHLRSLLGDHLIDVPSSDRHTVKPWFQGKTELAPPVPDLSAQGFVLTGGRLDVIGGRKTAVVIYKRREHVINLWVSPGSDAPQRPELRDVEGYHVLAWSAGGMTFRAVSDVDAGELRRFGDLIRASL
jgi:anti-sigma factor RsiW